MPECWLGSHQRHLHRSLERLHINMLADDPRPQDLRELVITRAARYTPAASFSTWGVYARFFTTLTQRLGDGFSD